MWKQSGTNQQFTEYEGIRPNQSNYRSSKSIKLGLDYENVDSSKANDATSNTVPQETSQYENQKGTERYLHSEYENFAKG